MNNVKQPTLKDVARLAETSIATASVVLTGNSKKFVSDALCRRVKEVAAELNYQPNISARRMKGKSGRFLAILVPQFENIFFHRVIIGAEKYASLHNYTLAIYSTDDEEVKEIKALENIISHQADGILICTSQKQSKTIELIKKAKFPYVVIDRPITEKSYDLVTVNYFEAAKTGTKLLIDNGHRKMAFFGWNPPIKSLTDRFAGFQAALQEANIDPNEVLIWQGERSREKAYEAALELLENDDYTAVFAGHHQLAEGIINALNVLGKKVPEDISVLIFGNPMWSTITNPQFSCVAQPDLAIGEKAAELIIHQLENSDHQFQQYELPFEICIRSSIRKI